MEQREYNIGDIVEYKGKRGIVVSRVVETYEVCSSNTICTECMSQG